MKRALAIILQLLRSNTAVALTYRGTFFQMVIGSFMWSGFSFISAFVVTSKTPDFLGMTRGDLLLLAATYGAIVGFHHIFFSHSFNGFSEVIHKGELDGYLLKPFDALLTLSLRRVMIASIPRFLGSIVMAAWIMHAYNFSTNIFQVLATLFLSLFAVALIYALYTLSCTVLIWHPYLSNIVDLMSQSIGTARYPLDIAGYTPKFITFFFLPFLIIVNIPTRALIGRLSLMEGLSYMLLCTGVFLFSRWFWNRALRYYTGASS